MIFAARCGEADQGVVQRVYGAEMANRRSYRRLLALPAWLLYEGGKLVASVRAEDAQAAREIFKTHKLDGTHMRKAP
jgi:hypothetical protein